MPSRTTTRAVRVTPAQGGRLMARVSSDRPGFADYTAKHEFRRKLDREGRREGHVLFAPNTAVEVGNQPYPQNQDYPFSGFSNGGFESDANADGVPDYWTLTQSLPFSIGAIDTSTHAEGSRSYRFTRSSSSAGSYLTTANLLALTAGRYVAVSWKHKTNAPTLRVQVYITWYDSAQGLITSTPTSPNPTVIYDSSSGQPSDWMKFAYSVTPIPGAAYAALSLFGLVTGDSVTGSSWFDEVSCVERDQSILPITLLAQVRRPNGKTAIIAGTPGALYRFRALDDGRYYEDVDDLSYFEETGVGAPYFELTGTGAPYFVLPTSGTGYFASTGAGAPYFAEENGSWIPIGTGFTKTASRWEAVPLNGYLVFNNGVDLPVTYREEDESVQPIYEMREAGIASVGTIAEESGILVAGDVNVLKSDQFESNFAHTSGGAVQLSQPGAVDSHPIRKHLTGTVEKNGTTAVAGTSTSFTTELEIGDFLRIDGSGGEEVRKVTAIASNTALTVDYAYAGTDSGQTGKVYPYKKPALIGTGERGYMVHLDGTDDFITVADAASLDFTTYMTAEAVIRMTSLPGSQATIMAKGAAWDFRILSTGQLEIDFGVKSTATGIVVTGNVAVWTGSTHGLAAGEYVTIAGSGVSGLNGRVLVTALGDLADASPTTKFRYQVLNGTASEAVSTATARYILQSGSRLVAGTWYHVAAVYDGMISHRLFVNGVLDAQQNGTGDLSTNATALTMGAKGGAQFANMDIAEARVWNVARGESDLLAKMFDDLSATASGLRGYWKLNETSGTTAADSQTNVAANTGTLTGTPAPSFSVSDAPSDAYVVMAYIEIASITVAALVATVVTETPHGFLHGQTVFVTGAASAGLNGKFDGITYISASSFSYAVASGATESPSAAKVREAQWFDDSQVGDQIVFANGVVTTAVAFVGATEALKVNSSVASLVGQNVRFWVVNQSEGPAATGTVARTAGQRKLTGTGTDFNSKFYRGMKIRVVSTTPTTQRDEYVTVIAVTSNTVLWVDPPFINTNSGGTVSGLSSYSVVSPVTNYFTAAMVGRWLYWTNGASRKITSYLAADRVATDAWFNLPAGTFSLNNITAYNAITNKSLVDRIQYRMAWSQVGEPRRWAANFPAAMTIGSRVLELAYPVKSLSAGMSITVLGAGVNGSSLTANILLANPNGTTLILDQPAENTVTDSLAQASDTIGSITGFYDIQGDASPILKMLDLSGTLVVYKGTGIFLARYTGLTVSPFAVAERYRGGMSLHYRNTLIGVKGGYHIFAGRNSFYRFDLGSQRPMELAGFEQASNIFYERARLANTNDIFAAANGPTKEIFFMFPSADQYRGLCYDWFTETLSTTSADYTAMDTLERPQSGLPTGAQPEWCVCGDSGGRILLYGKSDEAEELLGGSTVVYHRNGADYPCRLRGGLLGTGYGELSMVSYMLELASQSVADMPGVQLNFYGYNNAASQPVLLDTLALDNATIGNMVPMHFVTPWFQDEIVVTGVNKPCELAARIFDGGQIGSKGLTRIPL